MRHRHRWFGMLGVVLYAAFAASSMAAPLLDRAASGREAVWEGEHDPARCQVGHDHTICRLVNGNQPAGDASQEIRLPDTSARVPLPPSDRDLHPSSIFNPRHSRAPPA